MSTVCLENWSSKGHRLTRIAHPPLGSRSVHVWSLDLSSLQDEKDEAAKILSPDELERGQRFVQAEDRARFTTTRFFLREILASYAGGHPAELRFNYSEYGKPSLSSHADSISFSVSHSGQRALISVTHGNPVGVDVEFIRDSVEIASLAERFFSPSETATLESIGVEKRQEAFFRIWTAKEAFLKALGAGLSRALNSFDVELDARLDVTLKATRPDPCEALRWRIYSLRMPKGYEGALVTESNLDPPLMIPLG